MAFKIDAEHIPGFPLVPIGTGPQLDNAGQGQVGILQRHLEAEITIAAERHQVINHGEFAVRLALTVYPQALVDGGKVIEHLKHRAGFRLQCP